MAFRPTIEQVFSVKDLEESGLSAEAFKAEVSTVFGRTFSNAILNHNFATDKPFAMTGDKGTWVLDEAGNRLFEIVNWSSPVVGRFKRDGVHYAQTASGDVVAVVPTIDF